MVDPTRPLRLCIGVKLQNICMLNLDVTLWDNTCSSDISVVQPDFLKFIIKVKSVMNNKPHMRQNLRRRQLQKFEVFQRLLLYIAHDDFSQWFPFFGV